MHAPIVNSTVLSLLSAVVIYTCKMLITLDSSLIKDVNIFFKLDRFIVLCGIVYITRTQQHTLLHILNWRHDIQLNDNKQNGINNDYHQNVLFTGIQNVNVFVLLT